MTREFLFAHLKNELASNKSILYEQYKGKIQRMKLPPAEYKATIKILCDILEY